MQSILFDNQRIIPSKVVCIGRNYVAHIEELGNERPDTMVLFNKPNSAITDTVYACSEVCRFEGEITFLIHHGDIVGVGVGLDLTKVDVQNRLKAKGLPWERAKGFDGSAVLSPFIPLRVCIESLRMTLALNGRPVQEAHYDLMIHKPDTMLKEITAFMTLEDGDVIMSGTPAGVGSFKAGDRFEARIFSHLEEIFVHAWSVAAH